MIEMIIKASSSLEDLVLDCFMGSGTTAVACQNLNKNFVGCEKMSNIINYTKKISLTT